MMPRVPTLLDELEHQALDRLEDESLEGEAEPIDGVDPDDRRVVEAAFARLAPDHADRLLAAALALAEAAPELALDRGALARARAHLAAEPALAPALAPTLELLALALGLPRAGMGFRVLLGVGERASAQAPAELGLLSAELAALLRDAWPREGGEPPSRALRVFRVAALAGAGPSLRARSLAAEQPELLRLADGLLRAHPDASADELVAAFEAVQSEPEQRDEAPQVPGPKRRFTWVHALLAAIIAALTLWHYLLR